MLHFHQTYRNICHGFLRELKILLHFIKRGQLNFCITEPYLLIFCWKNLLNRTIMVLEEVSTTTQKAACQSWTVVKLWEAAIYERFEVNICEMHHCFYFTLPFKTIGNAIGGYNYKYLYPILRAVKNFIWKILKTVSSFLRNTFF